MITKKISFFNLKITTRKEKNERSETNGGYSSIESHYSVFRNCIEYFWGSTSLKEIS